VADSVSCLGGWRFRCFACDWGWGHPQFITYQEALDARDAAKGNGGHD